MSANPFELPLGRNIPWEPAAGPIRQVDAQMVPADNVTIAAAATQTPLGIMPVIVFQFANSSGQAPPFPPIAMIARGRENLDQLLELLHAACDGAMGFVADAGVLEETAEVLDEAVVLCGDCGRQLHGGLALRGWCLTCKKDAAP